MDIIDHGHGIKTKWDIKVHGKMPPNPDIEVRHTGRRPGEPGQDWAVVQQRSERVFGEFADKDEAIRHAEQLAEEHGVQVVLDG